MPSISELKKPVPSSSENSDPNEGGGNSSHNSNSKIIQNKIKALSKKQPQFVSDE
jgi:hypothetical protein